MRIDDYLKALSGDTEIEIVTDRQVLENSVAENYSRTRAAVPAAVVYPVSAEQVEAAVKAANGYEVPLTVRSSSGNASLSGTSLPWVGGSVVINLSKMNKIIHVDELNCMAIVEAGVTFEQLGKELEKHGLYMEHPLQAKAEKSVIASLLDREPVLTAKHMWDVPDPLCAMKIVFGNGRLFGSGSAAGPGTLEEMLEAGCAMNQSQGPVWLDLGRVMTGSQGTLAICCWASVKVKRIGSVKKMAYVQSDDINILGEYASQVIRRRLGEEAVLLNRRGVSEIFGLDGKNVRTMPEWTYITSVRGYNYFPEEHMENQYADMEDIAGGCGLKVITELPGLANGDAFRILSETSGKNDFWKLRRGTGIVDLFCLNTIDAIDTFAGLAKKTAEKCGLDPEQMIIYAQPGQMARNCHIEFLIEAGEKAEDMEKMLGEVLLDHDAFFSRPYGQIEAAVYEKYRAQRHFMPAIKKFFDEKGILNPGKLANGYKGGMR